MGSIQHDFSFFISIKMSDKRRRRIQNSDESEHSDSDEAETKNTGDELEQENDEGVASDSVHEQGESEYESADDDIEIIDEVIQGENGSGEEPYPGVERQEGDGEETPSSPTTLD